MSYGTNTATEAQQVQHLREVAAMRLRIGFTTFPDLTGKSKQDHSDVPWPLLVKRMMDPQLYPTKSDCPLISFAEFGEHKSDKGSLRHDANVKRLFASVIDYDGGLIRIQQAQHLLEKAGVLSVLYSTPSNSAEHHYWRCIAPYQEPASSALAREYTGRLNQLLGGIASSESFALSQSYYYGHVQGAVYNALETDGSCIDLRSDIAPLYFKGNGEDKGVDRSRELKDRIWNDIRGGVTEEEIHERYRNHPHVLDQADGRRAVQRAIDYVREHLQESREGTSGKVVAIATKRKKEKAEYTDWRKLLRTDSSGIINDEENIRLALVHDPALEGLFKFDEFAQQLIRQKAIPNTGDDDVSAPWTDADTSALATYLQRCCMKRLGRDKVYAVVNMLARYNHSFHPVREYLLGLKWDGTKRLSNWLTYYLGAEEQPAGYLEAVGRAFLISAVARILKPGCKVDTALVMEGPQGALKSMVLKVLAGSEYFSDSLPSDLACKDAKEHLTGKWIIELPELAQFRRSEIETVKAFLSRQNERYRPSYGRCEIIYPRQCVFAGSTNEEEYLVDRTGNRRFWPVKLGTIDIDALTTDRDQLWAEAVTAYQAGEIWYLKGDVEKVAVEQTLSRVSSDPWLGMVDRVLKEIPLCQQNEVSPGEVMDRMDLRPDQRHPQAASRIGKCLRELGWKRKPHRHMTRGQLYEKPQTAT